MKTLTELFESIFQSILIGAEYTYKKYVNPKKKHEVCNLYIILHFTWQC